MAASTGGRLEGKVAVITGAARGQGEAEARLFVRAGARVREPACVVFDGSQAATRAASRFSCSPTANAPWA